MTPRAPTAGDLRGAGASRRDGRPRRPATSSSGTTPRYTSGASRRLSATSRSQFARRRSAVDRSTNGNRTAFLHFHTRSPVNARIETCVSRSVAGSPRPCRASHASRYSRCIATDVGHGIAQSRIRRSSGGIQTGGGRAPHLRVDGDHTVLVHDDRVQVHLGDLGHVLREPRDAQDQVFERGDVERRRTAVAEQQRRGAQRPNELVRVGVGDGQDPQRAVGEQLGGDAAEAEQQERSEQRVLGDADDDLQAGRRHPLHDRAVPSSRRNARASRRTPAAPRRGARGRAHTTDVGLVHDLRPIRP